MTFSPETASKLVAEALEDDAKMTPGPWEVSPFTRHDTTQRWRIFLRGHSNPQTNTRDCDWTEHDAKGIARTRNSLRALAEQLAGARARVEELERACDAHASTADDFGDRNSAPRAQIAQLTRERDFWQQQVEMDHRGVLVGKLVAENKRLVESEHTARKENERLAECLKRANDNHEKYERLFYLVGDARDRACDLLEDTGIYPTKWSERAAKLRAVGTEELNAITTAAKAGEP